MDAAQFNAAALNPAHSVIVEACAGSGKTWLLVSRIVRLLLDGADPSSILAITFTHKAAGEMRSRLNDNLRFCATAEDSALRDFLRERAVPDSELEHLLPRARTLFETMQTAQPGLKLLTFHAWFFELIRRAPLHAGWTGYSLTEQTGALRASAWARLIEHLQQQPASALAQDMQSLFAEVGLSSTRQLLDNFLQQRSDWWAYTEGQVDPAAWAAEQLRAQCKADP